MKKNITINLCGRLFNIDEDAYELLRNYMDTLRSFFARQEGGEEIADDIEQRIGELLEELKSQGIEAINIGHVKQIVTRIGQPEEMGEADHLEAPTTPPPTGGGSDGADFKSPADDAGADGAGFLRPCGSKRPEVERKSASRESGSSNSFHQGSNSFQQGDGAGASSEEEKAERPSLGDFLEELKGLFRERRFYRNPKDKMLAGVLSGLASSFEVDVTLLRLAVVAAVLLLSLLGSVFGRHHWMMFLNMNVWLTAAGIYLILALIIPEAETPEQQLKMQGKPVNMQNLAEEVVQGVGETVGKVKQSSVLRRMIDGFLRFCAGLFKAVMILLALALFFGGVFALLYALLAIYSPDYITRYFDWDMASILHGNLPMFVMFLVAFLAVLFIPAYAIVQYLIHPLKTHQRIVLLLVWLVAVASAFVTGMMLTQITERYYHERHADAIQKDAWVVTDDGISMRLYELEFLNQHGWRILNGEGCNDRFTAKGEYYLNNRHSARYLDCYDEQHRQRYRAENGESLMPGRYRLTVAARANGRGAFVYTLIDGQKTLLEIPVSGNIGGGIWQAAVDSLNHVSVTDQSDGDEPTNKPAVDYLKEIAQANGGKGYGWHRLVFEPIIIKEPHTVVNYGVTTDPDFTGQSWLGQWFSACDFVIERVEG